MLQLGGAYKGGGVREARWTPAMHSLSPYVTRGRLPLPASYGYTDWTHYFMILNDMLKSEYLIKFAF